MAENNVSARHPRLLTLVAVAMTVAAMAWLVWGEYRSYGNLEEVVRRHVKIEELRSSIIHLDEVLTMSARMAAATGDLEWETRYRKYEPSLDLAITEAVRLSDKEIVTEAVRETQVANSALVRMENQAFDFVRQGLLHEAQAVLFSSEYETEKQAYVKGMGALDALLQNMWGASLKREKEKAFKRGVSDIVLSGLILTIWVFAMRSSRGWQAILSVNNMQLVQRTQELSELNRTLDAQVRERTEELASLNAKNRAIVEAVPDALLVVDQGGIIRIMNVKAESMFGYSREEFVGRLLTDIIPQRFHSLHKQKFGRYFDAPHSRVVGQGGELFALRRDGTEVPVEIGLNPLQTSEGVFVIGTVRDISERLRAQEALADNTKELARSNAELEQFAYVASHDLQEPLRMVSSFTQLLAKRYKGKLDADADEFIGFAVDGASRMQHLIQDLLAYSRVGRVDTMASFVPLEDALKRALLSLQAVVEESGASVTYNALPTIKANEMEMTQLFQNLIGNALKYRSDAPPRVHVSAMREGGAWKLSVRDNGIGIDPQFSERIFGIFQRLHGKNSAYSGTGIGLALCKKIVERRGGRIWVESKSGEGATFYFTFPSSGDNQL